MTGQTQNLLEKNSDKWKITKYKYWDVKNCPYNFHNFHLYMLHLLPNFFKFHCTREHFMILQFALYAKKIGHLDYRRKKAEIWVACRNRTLTISKKRTRGKKLSKVLWHYAFAWFYYLPRCHISPGEGGSQQKIKQNETLSHIIMLGIMYPVS